MTPEERRIQYTKLVLGTVYGSAIVILLLVIIYKL